MKLNTMLLLVGWLVFGLSIWEEDESKSRHMHLIAAMCFVGNVVILGVKEK